MARPLRLHLPGGFYHTTLRGNHRENIFAVESDRLLLNTIVEAALAKLGARMHAYCWMTNHLHMLVQVGEQPLSRLMQRIAAGYARAFQSNRETTGHLFENRYHAILVDADSYLLELIRYIHLNPVRARIASHPHEYRWSSHHAYVGLPVDEWVSTGFGLSMFSPDSVRAVAAYRRFVNCDAFEISSPLEQMNLDQPEVLGSDAFCSRIRQQFKLPPPPISFDSLVKEGCERFGLEQHQLLAALRNERITAARAWIARRAIESRIATVTGVARKLRCDPHTIRRALEQVANDGDGPKG
jgi:putative transposase